MDSNKIITNWRSTRMSPEKMQSFDTNIEPTMFNLANGRIIFKLNNSVLVQKKFSSFYSNLILNLYIVCELNESLHNPIENFPLKNYLFGSVKIVINAIKSKFIYPLFILLSLHYNGDESYLYVIKT